MDNVKQAEQSKKKNMSSPYWFNCNFIMQTTIVAIPGPGL